MTMISDKVRELIRQQRTEKGISIREMADRLHVDERTYARIESGERKMMDVNTVEAISQLLEMDIWDILAKGERNVFNTMNDNAGKDGINETVNDGEMTINYSMDADLKEHYVSIIAQLNKMLADKDALIGTLRHLLKMQE